VLPSSNGVEGSQDGQQSYARVSSAVAAELGTSGPSWLGGKLVDAKAFEKESKKGGDKDNNARDVGGGKCDGSAMVNVGDGGDGGKSPKVWKRLPLMCSKVGVK